MKFKKRDGLVSSILGFFTCGIYSIYFWLCYGQDVNEICWEDGKKTPNYIVALILNLFTCGIYGMYWTYCLASRLDTASKKYGVNVESPVFFTLFMNIPFLSYFYSCDVMNKFQQKYVERNEGENGYPRQTIANDMGAEISSQLKSAVKSVGSSIKSGAQDIQQNIKENKPAQPRENVCPNCGKPVKPGDKFCMNCGTKIS